MAFMGYETPVEMPSMDVYNTDLMKMYIAGVKDLYEKGQEEMKDFLKTYGDFYSDVPGLTQVYNDLTIGGARRMLDQMQLAGIDPFKSPEARAAILRYIWSVPTGKLNEMKRSAENAKEYKKNLAKAMQDPNFDPEFNKWMIGGDLDTWDPNKPWTVTAPYIAPSMKDVATPYMEKFKQSEILDSDRPGYIKLGTTDANQLAAIRGVLENWEQTPWGRYNRYKADQQAAQMVDTNGNPLSTEQQKAVSDLILRSKVDDFARQFFQPEYKDDWKAKLDAEAAKQIRVHAANAATDHYYHRLENPDKYDEKGNPIRTSNGNGTNDTADASSHLKFSRDMSTNRIVEQAKKKIAKGKRFTVKTKNGKNLSIVSMKLNGLDQFFVEDLDGKYKGSSSGKKYRLATEYDLLTLAFAGKRDARSKWFSVSVKDMPKVAVASTGVPDPDLKPNGVLLSNLWRDDIFVTNDVFGANGSATKALRSAIENGKLNNTNVKVVPDHRTGSVVSESGEKNQYHGYTLYGVKIKDGEIVAGGDSDRLHILQRIGLYDEYGTPTSLYAPLMAGLDADVTGSTYGQGQVTTLHNSSK